MALAAIPEYYEDDATCDGDWLVPSYGDWWQEADPWQSDGWWSDEYWTSDPLQDVWSAEGWWVGTGDDFDADLQVCGLSSNNPSTAEGELQDIMVDSGSQSTACRLDFAPQYAVDDSEASRLWDIQNGPIASYGRKIVDVDFVGDTSIIPGNLRMDASDVSKNVAAMGRLLRAG